MNLQYSDVIIKSRGVGYCNIQNIPVIAQHYIVCGTEECKNNCQFSAIFVTNNCADNAEMNIHQKAPETKSHEVVPYLPGKRKPPVEKCKEHSSKDIEMI